MTPLTPGPTTPLTPHTPGTPAIQTKISKLQFLMPSKLELTQTETPPEEKIEVPEIISRRRDPKKKSFSKYNSTCE